MHIKTASVVALAILSIGFASSAQADSSATYYGTLATSGSAVLAELDCTTTAGVPSACDARSTNKTSVMFDSPAGDLHRVQGKFQDRESNGKAVYTTIDWYSSAQVCVTGNISVGGSSASGGGSASLCSGWLKVSTTSTAKTQSSPLVAFTLDKWRGATQNSSRANVRVCEDNVLWLTDTCSGNRVLTVDYL